MICIIITNKTKHPNLQVWLTEACFESLLDSQVIGPDEQEMADDLYALARHLHPRKVDKSYKNTGA